MIVWLFVVMGLSLFQIVGTYFLLPAYYIYVANLLVLLSALGMTYRVWKKQQIGYIEALKKEIEELKGKVGE